MPCGGKRAGAGRKSNADIARALQPPNYPTTKLSNHPTIALPNYPTTYLPNTYNLRRMTSPLLFGVNR
jgi:hypothetical protein